MKAKLNLLAVCLVAAIFTFGCSVGNAPPGMSGDDAKNAVAKMKPEDRIRAIAGSPMPGVEKEKEFAKIEKETGVKASVVLGSGSVGSPGAGAANTGSK